MEVELKYKLKDRSELENIWEDDFLKGIEEKGSREKILMKASYFDTEDSVLSKNDIAFRVRMEGSRMVASLKWNDKDAGIGGLHIREELNVPVTDAASFIAPKADIFKESEVGRDLLEVLDGKPLVSIMEINFLRSKARVDVNDCICEVSLDEGEIVTDKGTLSILEMEVELFTGEQKNLLELGDRLVEKYDLKPEVKSKYSRGLELINEQ